MAKKIVQDVVPPEGRSIRNIPISNRRPSTRSVAALSSVAPRQPSSTAPAPSAPTSFSSPESSAAQKQLDSKREVSYGKLPPKPRHRSTFGRKGIWIVAAICVIVLLFAVSFFFASAEVEIEPKIETTNISATILAQKVAEGGMLGYEVVTISQEMGKTAPASGEEKVEKKASGRIKIFNKHSTSSQKLVASTRFETPGGFVYRIAEPVTVPGYTTKNGEVIPGSISATVYADVAGTAHNIGLSDFTIPGFKGDPKFTNIYARSETAMQGGFSGTVKKIAPETLATTEEEIKTELRAELIKSAQSQIPESLILYPSAASFTFESMPQTEVTDTSVKINERGTITAIILDRNALNAQLAVETLTEATPGEVYVSNLEGLEVSLPENVVLTSDYDKDLALSVEGSAAFIWILDEQKVKEDLAGKPKKSLGSVLSGYIAVNKAKVILRPFWNRSFPKDPGKITIKVKVDE